MDELDFYAQEETAPETTDGIELATVAAVGETGVTLLIDGNEESGTKEYRVNVVQPIQAGDRVKISRISGSYVVEYVVGSPMERCAIPPGGTDGQVITKDGNSPYAVKWATVGSLPSGGSAGQALTKKTATDYDVEWSEIGAIPSGGSTGQVLRKTSATNYAVEWETIGTLPSGGTTGQYLMKSSNTNYAVEWSNAPATDRLTSSAKHVIYNGSALYADATSSLGSSSYYWNGCYLSGAIRLGNSAYNSTLGFFGTTPQSQQRVSSSATLSTLISALQKYGLIGS